MAIPRSVFQVGSAAVEASTSGACKQQALIGPSQPSLTSQNISASGPVIVALRVLHPEWVAPEAISVSCIHLPQHILCLPEAWLAADGPAQLHIKLGLQLLDWALRGILGPV